jgi:hypothetical protein
MYVDTNISFWYSEGEHRTEWKKEIGTYSRIRAVIIEK